VLAPNQTHPLHLGEGYPAIVNPPLTLKICPVT
jgi:hypothetical protein